MTTRLRFTSYFRLFLILNMVENMIKTCWKSFFDKPPRNSDAAIFTIAFDIGKCVHEDLCIRVYSWHSRNLAFNNEENLMSNILWPRMKSLLTYDHKTRLVFSSFVIKVNVSPNNIYNVSYNSYDVNLS